MNVQIHALIHGLMTIQIPLPNLKFHATTFMVKFKAQLYIHACQGGVYGIYYANMNLWMHARPRGNAFPNIQSYQLRKNEFER